jgi:hypothetical protein
MDADHDHDHSAGLEMSSRGPKPGSTATAFKVMDDSSIPKGMAKGTAPATITPPDSSESSEKEDTATMSILPSAQPTPATEDKSAKDAAAPAAVPTPAAPVPAAPEVETKLSM